MNRVVSPCEHARWNKRDNKRGRTEMRPAMATPITAALDAGSPENGTNVSARSKLGDGDQCQKAWKENEPAMATPITAALDAGSPENGTNVSARSKLGDGDQCQKAWKENEASNQTLTKDANHGSAAAAAAGRQQQGRSSGSSRADTAAAGQQQQQQGSMGSSRAAWSASAPSTSSELSSVELASSGISAVYVRIVIGITGMSRLYRRFYCSCEVALGCAYSSAIGMWSLGCVVAELFLGLPLFYGLNTPLTGAGKLQAVLLVHQHPITSPESQVHHHS
ncbi:hypothetical protein QJQ45_018767 [Haematococcus lacustris]|nr:hypothetical protein QJQ45_018767 [Haematococcus lacustris]